MVLIVSLFVVELHFFFMNFREGVADIVSCMCRAILSQFAHKTTKISHSILIEMKIIILHVIP